MTFKPGADITDASSSDHCPRSLPDIASVFVIQSPLLDFTLCFDCCWSNWRWKAVVARSIFGSSFDRASIRSDGVSTANGDEGFRAVLIDHQSSCKLNTLAFLLTRSNWTVIQGLFKVMRQSCRVNGPTARQSLRSLSFVGGEVQSSDTGGVPYEPTFNFDIISSLAFPSIEFASTLLQYQFSKVFAELYLSKISPKKTSFPMIPASSLWRA